MPYVVVFDIETCGLIQNSQGRTRNEKVENLVPSCVVAVKLNSDLVLAADDLETCAAAEYFCFWSTSGSGWAEPLLELFDCAEVVCGYNSLGFDHLVLKKYYANPDRYHAHTTKALDPFARLRDATTVWYKLDALLEANGLGKNTGDGLEAVRLWEAGKLEELERYCSVDVYRLIDLVLMPRLRLPGAGDRWVSGGLYGLAPMLAGIRHAGELVVRRLKRSRSPESEIALTVSTDDGVNDGAGDGVGDGVNEGVEDAVKDGVNENQIAN